MVFQNECILPPLPQLRAAAASSGGKMWTYLPRASGKIFRRWRLPLSRTRSQPIRKRYIFSIQAYGTRHSVNPHKIKRNLNRGLSRNSYHSLRVLSGGKLVNKAFRILQQHILLPGKAGQAHGKITLIPERQKNAPAFLRRLFRGQDADVDSAGQLLRIPNQRHAVRPVQLSLGILRSFPQAGRKPAP